MEATNLADLYHLPLLEWSGVDARLSGGQTAPAAASVPSRGAYRESNAEYMIAEIRSTISSRGSRTSTLSR